MNYPELIEELTAEIEEIKAEIEELEELDFEEDELEPLRMLELKLESKEEELEALKDEYEDYQYSNSYEMRLNGLSYSNFI